MEFDYVVIGGGSAGAAVACRLSDDPDISVCVLEAGGKGQGLGVRAQAGMFFSVPGFLPHLNWRCETTPQVGLNGRRGFQPRGKCLGGSSAINASMYVRGHPSDYDEWADLGCEGCSFGEVLSYSIRSENNKELGGDDHHGADGPLHVRTRASPDPISDAFLRTAEELQILPLPPKVVPDFDVGL